MIDLTFEQISAAKAKDLSAITAVIEATEERVMQLARRFATGGGRTDLDLMEDLAQVGRIAVWQGLERFAGSTVAEFFKFIDSTVQGHLSNERKSEQRQGVSRDVAAEFEKALSMADGDPYRAEKIACDPEMMTAKRVMTPETAYAARLSYQGITSLDAPVKGGEEAGTATLADMLADAVEVPADLLLPSDFDKARRAETRRRVHFVLVQLSKRQQTVLKALTGISPVGFYGNENDDDLSADHGIPASQIPAIRSLGIDRFRELYSAHYAF